MVPGHAEPEPAIALMVEATQQKPEDVAKAYDFLQGRISSMPAARCRGRKMTALLDALKALGDVEGSTDVERFVLPGITQLAD